jgi:hypothetical protein
MRILLKFDLSLEAGNEAVCSGKIAELNHSLMERIQPEAAYYSTENGKRISYIFFDLKDPSQLVGADNLSGARTGPWAVTSGFRPRVHTR